ncbi:hypothetical protein F4814DRAFT_444187 [Daldinia grandis]|nr:hypothetical protein F4814DRAFT_444187 [Daldinia grandis]
MLSGSLALPPRPKVNTAPERRRRIQQHRLHRYMRLRTLPADFIIDEYEPRGRFFDFNDMPPFLWDAWWRGRGIPHEVSRPPVNDPDSNIGVIDPAQPWIPFKRWMMDIARNWTRPWTIQPQVNPELFGDIYNRDCARISFFRVMRYRLSVHRSYAYWTGFSRKYQHSAQTDTFEHLDGRRTQADEFDLDSAEIERSNHRQSIIMLTLIGLNNYNVEDELVNNAGVDELRDFIQSPAVRGPWLEFVNDYLQYYPDTQNPVWSILQPALANRDIQILRRNYYLSVDPDKRSWTLMDHAVRFIMRVYHHGFHVSEAREREDLTALNWPWEHYFYSQKSATDMEDRHWFGFSLLMLLVSSWQFNRIHPHPEYDQVLVPALYPGYKAQKWEFVEGDAGMVDISPTSKWECEEDVKSNFDFTRAHLCGFIGSWEQSRYYEDESDTPIDRDGYRVNVKRPDTSNPDDVDD